MGKENDDVKITVIVTVHNAEKYLEECLNSVVDQTFSNIEILCMDGGSTDKSPAILKEYAKKDKRIHIINDPDTSYGHKINEGIRLAKGKYVAMLESDDMYCLDMLKQLYNIAKKYQPDYVNANYLNFFDVGGTRYEALAQMYEKEDYGKLLESGKHPENMRQILRYWTGIFRKEFLLQKEIWMNESPGASFQDMSFRFLTSALADTCYHLDASVYQYRIDNPNSSVYDPKKAAVIADEFEFLKRELMKRQIEEPVIWRHYYNWKYNDFYGNLYRFGDEARKALFERCYEELEKDRKIFMSFSRKERSRAANDLLEKSREEMWENFKNGYEKNREREMWMRDLLERTGDKGIVICGCGIRGKRVTDYLRSVGAEKKILCFADNSEELRHSRLSGHLVLRPGEAVAQYPEGLYVIANKYHWGEIYKQLLDLGVKEEDIVKEEF